MIITTKYQPIECELCQRKFKNESDLFRHEKRDHGYSCPDCDRHFGSQNALNQHSTASHSVSCELCNMSFGGESARTQHLKNAHWIGEFLVINSQNQSYSCTYCGNNWEKREKLFSHMCICETCEKEVNIKYMEDHNDIHDYCSPPVSTSGYWVLLEDFSFKKSFGHFECQECGKTWTSAHSYKKYKQGCNNCETYNSPIVMWVNKDEDSTENDNEDEGPHDMGRCEKCIKLKSDCRKIEKDARHKKLRLQQQQKIQLLQQQKQQQQQQILLLQQQHKEQQLQHQKQQQELLLLQQQHQQQKQQLQQQQLQKQQLQQQQLQQQQQIQLLQQEKERQLQQQKQQLLLLQKQKQQLLLLQQQHPQQEQQQIQEDDLLQWQQQQQQQQEGDQSSWCMIQPSWCLSQ